MKILLMLRDPFYEAYPAFIEAVSLIGEVKTLYPDSGIEKEEIIKEIANTDILVVAKVKIGKEVIDAGPRLKYIIKYGAGYDNIDIDYANQKGIAVTNSPGQNAESVADNVFGLMLAASRKITKKDHEMKHNQWELSVGHEIYKKKLGIIGFGAIGKAVARRAKGFSMETIAYGHYLDTLAAKELNVCFVTLEELLETSDYIIISTALTERNKELIKKDTIRLMKSSAYIINVSRGGLINEIDLIDALQNKQIKGAGLDVFSAEPPQNELPLLDNVVATPHIGGATYEALERMADVTIANIKRFLAGEELLYRVYPREVIK
ncbi:phosphoglycerate dehydrogenase [Robertmurraya massiliosenegalensis]|uniref:2-hydroxyacid dehydrogenase n=1 Tax=Robertmurraya TaxID=2837507 RepID=UPI0039A7836F